MPYIDIGNKHIRYKFEINGKYSLIKGDSGTGKTTLCDLVQRYERGIEGIISKSSNNVMTLPAKYRQMNISAYENAVIFIDEEEPILREKGYEQWLQTVNAYFVFITRDLNLRNLPVSVDSIYTMHTSGRLHSLKHIDARFEGQQLRGVDMILTEDSNSGKEFMAEVVKYANSINVPVMSAEGKDNIVAKAHSLATKYKNIVLVYDAAGYGVSILDLKREIQRHSDKNFFVIDWESFENYILGSPAINMPVTLQIAGCKAESLEVYSEEALRKIFRYSKRTLIHCLRIDGCRKCSSKCPRQVYDFKGYIYWKVKTLYDFLVSQKKVEVNNGVVDSHATLSTTPVRVQVNQKQSQSHKVSYTYYMQQAKRYSGVTPSNARARVSQVNYKEQYCVLTKAGVRRQFSISNIVSAVMRGTLVLSNPSALREWRGFIKD